jgi:hypothetical protein
MARSFAAAIAAVFVLSGCVYMHESVQKKKDGYENYPTSIEANEARRAKRRKHALIAAPIEIALGTLALTAAIYGKSAPPESDSTSSGGAIADAGKAFLARLFLASIGGAAILGGVSDGVLGALSPLLPNSIVRNGALVPASEIDRLPPPTTLRPTFEIGMLGSPRGIGEEVSLGASRWLTPTVRVNGSVVGEAITAWSSKDVRGSLYGQLEIERAFGREYLGLYPHRALGLYVLSGGSAIQDRDDDGGMIGGGVSARLGYLTYRVGVTFIPGVDERPMFVFRTGGSLQLE